MSDDDRTVDADPSTLDRLRRAARAADPDATIDVDAAGLRRLREAARDAEQSPPAPAVGSRAWLDDMPTPPAGTPRFIPEPPRMPMPPHLHSDVPNPPPAPSRPAFALDDLPDPGPRRPALRTSVETERWRPPPRSMQPVSHAAPVDHTAKWRIATIALALVAAALIAILGFARGGSSDDIDPTDVAVTTIPVGDGLDPIVVQQGEGGAGG